MPPAPPRLCKKCKKVTTNENGYCDVCSKDIQPSYKNFDRARGTPSQRGYDSSWRRFRNDYMQRHPLCDICLKEGRVSPSEELHHIVPLNEGGERLSESNVQALCKSCHSKITNDYRKGKNDDSFWV